MKTSDAIPLLDVLVVTYNHVNYVRQALDGIVAQKTDFPWRALVADDGSRDGTQDIIREYAVRYPALIIPFISPVNVGIGHGRESHAWSVMRLHGKAKYLTLVEGDDYWTDPLKLQKQVDVLEKGPQYSMCFHDINEVDVNGVVINADPLGRDMKRTLSQDEIASGLFRTPPTSSSLYRRAALIPLPDDFFSYPFGDRILNIWATRLGPAAYIDEKMSAYRRHAGGMATGMHPDVVRALDIKHRKLVLRHFPHLKKAAQCHRKVLRAYYAECLQLAWRQRRIRGLFSGIVNYVTLGLGSRDC